MNAQGTAKQAHLQKDAGKSDRAGGSDGAHESAPALKAFLLTRSWRDRSDGIAIELWGHSERGPVQVRLGRQRALFFVEQHVQTQAGERRPVELQSLIGRPVDAVYFPSQRALTAERERLLSESLEALEADVKPSERFLMERFITGAFEVQGPCVERDGVLRYQDPVLKGTEYNPQLSLLSFDVETDGFDGPLLSIASVSHSGERVFMIGPTPAPQGPASSDGSLHYVNDERELLLAFVAWVGQEDPDVLLGWNVIEFDLQRLIERARHHSVALTLGRGNTRAEVLPPRNRTQPHVARVPGRVVLDGIATLRAASYSFESFALEDVAQLLLGRGKAIDTPHDRVEEIGRMFRQDKPALARYNLEDCRLVRDIFEAAGLLGFAMERQQLTGLPMDRQGGAVAAFDHLYLPRLHRLGRVARSTAQTMLGDSSPGGYVMDSQPGLYENVLVLDFKSLYPSIIRTFRIDPLGLADPGEDSIEGFDGGRFSRHTSILPDIIHTLWRARDQAKRDGDGARSQAIKILMNSFYGVLGTPACRFFSPKLAASITRRGHEIITRSRDELERLGRHVIYGDTDSLFVLLGPGLDEATCAAMGAQLGKHLNEFWRLVLEREHRLSSGLEIEFETHYLRFLMPTMRGSERGTKKRYAGSTRRPEGGTELVFKGLEAVRTDWTPLARSFQRELFRRVFSDQPFEQYVQELAQDLRAGKLDEQLVYTKRLRRDLDEYVKNVPPHVQAARKLGNPGRRIRYYITTRGPEPAEARESPLDYQHYLDRQLAPAADSLLHFCGTSFERLASEQLSLF